MYNINESLTELDLKSEDFIKNIPEYDIYKYYIGNVKIGSTIGSPFRKDKNPSFGIYYSKTSNKLMFHDFATNEYGGVIDFVKTMESCNFSQAISKIKSILGKNSTRTKKPTHEYLRGNTKIGIVRQQFTEIDKTYWSEYHISEDILKKFRVFSIKYYLLNDVVKWTYNENSIMFAYKIFNHFKIYRPFEKTINKWRSNCNVNDIQGLEQLPAKGDLLVVTKSLKDVMVLYRLGIPAIAPHSETSKINKDVILDLKKRFNKIIIFYDNDEAGITNSATLYESIKELNNIYNICIDIKYKVKDISDFIKKYGKDKTELFLSEKFEKCHI